MKRLFTLVLLYGFWSTACAQETMEKVMEKRVRELHRVMSQTDKAQWKKFVSENYTQALINKPMRSERSTNDSDNSTKSSSDLAGNLEAKAEMFGMLNQDFGTSKIISIKPKDATVEMVVRNEEGATGKFTIKFEKTEPFLIDGIGVDVSMGD